MSDGTTLTSAFFNLAGGRRQDSADTFRVMSRLRMLSGDTVGFYAVTESSPPGPMGARARRLVLDVIQRELTSRFDLPHGARLKRAVAQANERLRDEFSGHVQIGLTILLSVESSLYLLQVPPGQAYVLHEGTLHSVSASSPDSASSFALALGGTDDPYVCLFKDTIEPGDVILLSGGWMALTMDPDDLRSAFAEESPRRITRTLFDIARHLQASELTCVAIQAETAPVESVAPASLSTERPQPRNMWEYVDDAVGSLGYVVNWARDELSPSARPRCTGNRPARFSPASAGAPAVASSTVPSATSLLDVPGEDDILDDLPVAQQSLTFDWPEHVTDEIPVVGGGSEFGSEPYEGSPVDAGRLPTSPRASKPTGSSTGTDARDQPTLDEVNSYISRTNGLNSVTPPVQGFPHTTVAPERINPGLGGSPGNVYIPNARTSRRRDSRTKRAGRAQRTSRVGTIPPAMLLWSFVGVALVLLIVLLASFALGGGTNYTAQAKSDADKALTAFNAKQQITPTASAHLAAAWQQIRLAVRHHASASSIADARNHVLSVTDTMYVIRTPAATLVHAFSNPRSHPTRLGTGSRDIFVMDPGRRQYWYINSASPRTKFGIPGRMGDANYNIGLGQTTFTVPRFMSTSFGPGFPDGNDLVGLDSHFDVLFNDPTPGTPTLTVEHLTPPGAKTVVGAITFWYGNLYILDRTTQQIYRYDYNTYNPSYAPFATTPVARLARRNALLKTANGLAIAKDGTVWVSLRQGTILKFTDDKSIGQYKPVKFTITGLPYPLRHASQIYVGNDPNRIWVANYRSDRILAFTTSGKYLETISPSHLPGRIRGMTISADGHTLYITSGHGLYATTLTGVS